jgi:hypothetical protein
MKMSLSFPFAAVLSSVLIATPVVFAQSGAGQTATPQRPAEEVTVTGCLQQQPAVTGAPVGHESGAAAGMLLTTTPPAPRSGAPATAAPAKPADSYLIAGTRAQELSRYVDEIVEVSGTLDNDIASDAGQAPTAATSSAKPIARHTIAVTTFRPTGTKCK